MKARLIQLASLGLLLGIPAGCGNGFDIDPGPTEQSTAFEVATLSCGDNVKTYTAFGDAYQKLTYKNCSDLAKHRQADINNWPDPACQKIAPHGSKVIADIKLRPTVYIRGSDACSTLGGGGSW